MHSNGFSYLLKSLKISPSKMSQALNVDRTLISKWKNGSRKIDTNAAYFDSAIDFLIQRNEELGNDFLEKLFLSIYDSHNYLLENSSSLKKSLKKFIFDDINEHKQINNNFIQNGSLYSTTISIYNDESKGLLGILSFLDSAILYGKPQNLLFVFCKNLDLIMDNKEFMNKWLEKVLILLDMGYVLDLVYSNSNSSTLALHLSSLINHKNCNLSYFVDSFDNSYNYSFYIVENNGVFMSSNQFIGNETQFYSTLFTDPISIKFYTTWAKNIFSKSFPIFRFVNLFEILDKFEVNDISLDHRTIFGNLSYYYNSFPVYTVMNEELYYEILCNSVDNEMDRQKYLNYFKIAKNNMHEKAESPCIHFYSIDDIIEFSKQQTIVYESESDMSPKLILSQEQFKRHLSCLADYLLNNDNYNICLVSDKFNISQDLFYCWCKKNEFLLINNNNNFLDTKFTTNTSLVNSVYLLLENIFLNTPENFKSKKDIINFLKNL